MNGLRLFALTLAGLLLAVVPIRGETGACRFDETGCSCKFGAENQGICWDRISGTTEAGTCQSRYCRPGWTCSCSGRTHMCPMENKTLHIIDNVLSSDVAECHEEVGLRASASETLELGSWELDFSREGLLQNKCNQVAMWHNGESLGSYGINPEITSSNVEEEIKTRFMHTKLELQKGDLLAFRIKDGSYYCYNSLSKFYMNGTMFDSTWPGSQTWFAKSFSQNWFLPSFIPSLSLDESTAGSYDFMPLRTYTRTVPPFSVAPGADMWQMDDETNSLDHMTSNFYFRIEL